MSQKTDLLRHVPLFAGCGTRQLEEIGQLADEVERDGGPVDAGARAPRLRGSV